MALLEEIGKRAERVETYADLLDVPMEEIYKMLYELLEPFMELRKERMNVNDGNI